MWSKLFFSHIFVQKLNLPKWGGSSFMPYNKKPQPKQNRRKKLCGLFLHSSNYNLRGLKRKSQTHDQRIRGLQIKKTETFEWKFKKWIKINQSNDVKRHLHTYYVISKSFICQRYIPDLEGFVPNFKALCKTTKNEVYSFMISILLNAQGGL
jgi:hypothetical protein